MMIDDMIQKRRIIITCGLGGVGKTTVSAALALRAAVLGKKAVVITIDPAKRLATSLGLEKLGDHPTDLTPLLHRACENAKKIGLRTPSDCKGTFAAIMPDTRSTFESFIRSLAPNEQIAERVMKNPIFQIFAREFSGANEYMAMERLYALDNLGEYDCIILDTPPSRNTLGFLEAPKLLAGFFDERLIKWLVLPTNKLVSGSMRKALGILERLTGSGFMTNLFDFAAALFEVRINFQANLQKITELLESTDVGFLLVAAPVPDAASEAGHFIRSVKEHRFHFDGVVLNRTLGYLQSPDSKNQPVNEAFKLMKALQDRENQSAEELLKRVSQETPRGGKSAAQYAKLPELARDVHSVEDLFHVAMSFNR